MNTIIRIPQKLRSELWWLVTQNRINDIRLKVLEDHVNLLQKQIDELQDIQSQKTDLK